MKALVLEGALPITPVSYRKTLRLKGSCLLLDYVLRNTGRKPLNLLWKLHPALRISAGAEIVVPARTARVADPEWSRVKDRSEFAWESQPDSHFVPPLNDSTEFLYLLDLAEGECALRHLAEHWSFRMRFPPDIFTSVWVFASFGGWRDLEVLILEPCTTPQLSLVESTRQGKCLHLEPGGTVEARVEVEVGS